MNMKLDNYKKITDKCTIVKLLNTNSDRKYVKTVEGIKRQITLKNTTEAGFSSETTEGRIQQNYRFKVLKDINVNKILFKNKGKIEFL